MLTEAGAQALTTEELVAQAQQVWRARTAHSCPPRASAGALSWLVPSSWRRKRWRNWGSPGTDQRRRCARLYTLVPDARPRVAPDAPHVAWQAEPQPHAVTTTYTIASGETVVGVGEGVTL